MTRLPTDKTLIRASALVSRREIRNALYPESFIQQIKSRLAHDIATQILKQVEITETEDMETDMIRYSAEFHCLTDKQFLEVVQREVNDWNLFTEIQFRTMLLQIQQHQQEEN
jgi:hypothetical protein